MGKPETDRRDRAVFSLLERNRARPASRVGLWSWAQMSHLDGLVRERRDPAITEPNRRAPAPEGETSGWDQTFADCVNYLIP